MLQAHNSRSPSASVADQVPKFPSSTGIQYYNICLLLRDEKNYGKD